MFSSTCRGKVGKNKFVERETLYIPKLLGNHDAFKKNALGEKHSVELGL